MLNCSEERNKAFQALSDPTRRSIIDRLTRGSASVSALAAAHDASLANILLHVQALEAGGLVTTEKIGRSRVCSVSGDGLARVEGWLAARRRHWENRSDRIEAPAAHDRSAAQRPA